MLSAKALLDHVGLARGGGLVALEVGACARTNSSGFGSGVGGIQSESAALVQPLMKDSSHIETQLWIHHSCCQGVRNRIARKRS